MRVVVSDARGAAAADAAAIAAGTPSRALMQRAGAAAAAEIAVRCAPDLAHGVVVATGAGNNGGDGWVIARALHAVGIPVRVVECVAARTEDAIAERALALADGVRVDQEVIALPAGGEHVAVDALLGTGFKSGHPLRGTVALAVNQLATMQARGAVVVAIDVPSGLDATTGETEGALHATFTLTFGTAKLGLLKARNRAGGIVVLDIGLGVHARHAGDATLATADWFRASLPVIPADAHKGTRRKIAIVGGAKGMAGAVLLAARAALRSGAGLVKCIVADESVLAIQKGEPSALAASWPSNDAWSSALSGWADAVLIGPGLGREGTRRVVESILGGYSGPVVLDADALNAFAGNAEALAPLLGEREALLTPHPLEYARLAGTSHVGDVSHEAQVAMARRAGAAILLKGTPTTIAAASGEVVCVAEGTPILATGGAGDVLGGIAVTLLAQNGNALGAGALAAFAHGRAASCIAATQVRGYTIEDVVDALPRSWSLTPAAPHPPVLAELPAIVDTR